MELARGSGFNVFQDRKQGIKTLPPSGKKKLGLGRRRKGLANVNPNAQGFSTPHTKTLQSGGSSKKGLRRRALGDITNNQSGGKTSAISKIQPFSHRKGVGSSQKNNIGIDIDSLLDEIDSITIDEIETVHGTSRSHNYDCGIDAAAVKKGMKEMSLSLQEDNIEILGIEKWDDPELDGLSQETTFSMKPEAKISLEDLSKFALFDDDDE